jgi:hypothetical protein
VDHFWGRTGKSGKLEGRFLKVFPTRDGRFPAKTNGATVVAHVVIGTILGAPLVASTERQTALRLGNNPHVLYGLAEVLPGAVYKARPLDGVWATAPYLHNGSVPSLYQLLLPADRRLRSFRVGSRVFDPVNVGFRTDAQEFFEFRTRAADGEPIPGNSNAGHEFGARLTDQQRWQLVEYLKTL